jgi:DNA-binding NarL/FixJ family response regulator
VAHQSSDSSLILIVDPEQSTRELAAKVLRKAGYATRQVESGEEALEIAKRERPRVVVLEVCLPGICGYEVCRELKGALGESVSIIFVSGTRKESFDRVGGLLLGADDYLVKPFAPDELLARVRGLIRRDGQSTSRASPTLTKREQDVLQLLAEGRDQKEIAAHLVISTKTVGTHLEHMFTKLGVRSRAQAVASAYRDDLLDKGPLHCSAITALLLHGVDFSEWLSVLDGVAVIG